MLNPLSHIEVVKRIVAPKKKHRKNLRTCGVNLVAWTGIEPVIRGFLIRKAWPSSGPINQFFLLPQLGPEGLTVVDSHHVVVVNDTNFPLSSVRTMGQPDHNELTLLNIKALVEAR